MTAKPSLQVAPEEASELFCAMTALPRPFRVLPYPRTLPGSDTPIGEVHVWPLFQEEQMAANAEADRFTKALLKDPQMKDQANLGYHHTYTNELAVQVIWRACRNVKDPLRPAFPSPKHLRRAALGDEIGVLFQNYCTVQAELGPIVAYMSKEEQEAMILTLQKGGSAFPFDSLSWEEQRRLLTSMASQLVSCWTAMSSAGLPLDVSTFAESQIKAMTVSQESSADPPETNEVSEPPTPSVDDEAPAADQE